MGTHPLLKLALTLVITLILTGSALAQRPDTDQLNRHFEDAILTAASARNLAIDPQLSQDMIVDISNFTFNFCMALPDACDRILGQPDNLQAILQQYLRDAEAGLSEIETLASRMALAAGTDITKAGRARMQANTLGMVDVSTEKGDVVFYLRAGNGITAMGGKASTLLMQPGSWIVLVEGEDGLKRQKHVLVKSRQTSLLSEVGEVDQVGRIEVKGSDYCPVTQVDAGNEVLAAFNFARAIQDDVYSHAAPVSQQVGIRIDIDDQTGLCDDACMKGVAAAFARALAIWRSGCGRCTENSLAVMASSNDLWLDRRAAAKLRAFGSASPSLVEVDLGAVDSRMPFQTGAVPSLTVPIKSYVGYDHLSADAALIKKLCMTQSPTGSDWIGIAQSFACGRRPSVERALTPRLTLTNGVTSCGTAAVACGMPEGEVQITLKDYALSIPTKDGLKRIGNAGAELDVQPVLLHEVGHWFGIPHPEAIGLEVKDIMSAVLNANHVCVSAQSLALLTNATDTRFEHRAKGSHGLTVDARTFTNHGE